MSRTKDLSGQRVGAWSIHNLKYLPTKRAKLAYWHCQCDCGAWEWVRASCIHEGTSSGCIRCGYKKGGVTLARRYAETKRPKGHHPLLPGIWTHIVKGAEVRDLRFDITYEMACNLFDLQKGTCALSGRRIWFGSNSTSKRGTASLDRINSFEGYVPGNIQWVHKDINRMKGQLPDLTFILICRFVAMYTADLVLDDGSGAVVPPLAHQSHPRPVGACIRLFDQARSFVPDVISTGLRERVDLSAGGIQRRQ